MRPKRPRDFEPAAPLPESRRQGHLRPLDADRPHRPLHRAIHLRHRPRLHRIPVASAPGSAMRSAPRTRICPAYIALGEGATIGDARPFFGMAPAGLQRYVACAPMPKSPIYDIKRPDSMSDEQQRRLLDMVERAEPRAEGAALPARSGSGSAHRQLRARRAHAARSAASVADLDQESEATRKLYGVDQKASGPFGKLCLMARRLVEKRRPLRPDLAAAAAIGTRTATSKANCPACANTSTRECRRCLTDLEQRGMMKDTLVVWSGEFGRLPTIEAKNSKPGRDHNPYGFSMWMAGAGVKPGFDFGHTDELGYAAIPEFRVGHADIHATIQHLLGIDYQEEYVLLRRPRRIAGGRHPGPRASTRYWRNDKSKAPVAGSLAMPAFAAATGGEVKRNGGTRIKIGLNAYSFNKPLMAGKMNRPRRDRLLRQAADRRRRHDRLLLPRLSRTSQQTNIFYALKRHAFLNGVTITGTGVRNDFALTDASSRRGHIQLVKDWIDVAAKLGSDMVRVFAGKEVPKGYTFDQVLAVDGPGLPGVRRVRQEERRDRRPAASRRLPENSRRNHPRREDGRTPSGSASSSTSAACARATLTPRSRNYCHSRVTGRSKSMSGTGRRRWTSTCRGSAQSSTRSAIAASRPSKRSAKATPPRS